MDEHSHDEKKPMPLEGIRIIEYGVFHAAPGAGSILGELGAEVIKIETGDGDPSRLWGDVGGADYSLSEGQTLTYQISNRNKKGIWLDIRNEKGMEIFHRLLQGADVFLTNLRKSTKTKMGIDYKTLSPLYPRLIYAGISGYGQEGPDADVGAYDPLGQARCGLMYTSGSEEPAVLNLAFLDQATAIAASHAILTALLVRERHGMGQEVHLSLYSAGLWLMYPNMVSVGAFSRDPNSAWNRLDNSPLRNRFRCKDDRWIISTHHPEDIFWEPLCHATGQPHLIDDPRFADHAARMTNCRELVSIFDEVFVTKTCDEWMKTLSEHKLMFSPVLRNMDVISDPQALANQYMVDFSHPQLGNMKTPGYPIHFSTNSAGTKSFGTQLGEDTEQVMKDIGYDALEIEELKKSGIIRSAKDTNKS